MQCNLYEYITLNIKIHILQNVSDMERVKLNNRLEWFDQHAQLQQQKLTRIERNMQGKLQTRLAGQKYFPTTSLSDQDNYRKALENNLVGRKRMVQRSVEQILNNMEASVVREAENKRRIKEAKETTKDLVERNAAVMASTAAWREYRKQRNELAGIQNGKKLF